MGHGCGNVPYDPAVERATDELKLDGAQGPVGNRRRSRRTAARGKALSRGWHDGASGRVWELHGERVADGDPLGSRRGSAPAVELPLRDDVDLLRQSGVPLRGHHPVFSPDHRGGSVRRRRVRRPGAAVGGGRGRVEGPGAGGRAPGSWRRGSVSWSRPGTASTRATRAPSADQAPPTHRRRVRGPRRDGPGRRPSFTAAKASAPPLAAAPSTPPRRRSPPGSRPPSR